MRINYVIHNYCVMCALTLEKNESRCPQCGRKVRTKAYYGSKAIEIKRV